jgi:hypothetical protein
MNEPAETKVCPLCAETIKAAAKICPWCRSKQGRHVVFWQELMLGGGALAMVAVVVWVLVEIAPEERGVGGRSFVGHQRELVVLSTSLDNVGGRWDDAWLVGVVTNRGDHAWRVHQLEVRFQDEKRGLLDVRQPSVTDVFVVLPRQTHAFRAQLGEVVFTNRTVRPEVRVKEATDGDRPLKRD